MSTPRIAAGPFLILAALAVCACGSSATTSAAASSATTAHGTPITSAGTGAMKMRDRQPENDAGAVAALEAHDTTAATAYLRAALATMYEPAAAKSYARQALGMLGRGRSAAAQVPAKRGAAVEHLSWALAALKAHDPKTASGHLMEAAMLPPASRAATAALAAIKAHHLSRAVSLVSAALRGLGV